MKNGYYTSLSDAATATQNSAYEPGTTKVYYAKAHHARNSMMGMDFMKKHTPESVPSRATLERDYVLVGTVNLYNLEDVFEAMQGEVWSPDGQARAMIAALGLTHTSMSTGDLVELNGTLHMVDTTGFHKLR